MSTPQSDRQYWVAVLERVARPVLAAGARGHLRASMPVEAAPGMTDRAEYTHLEAVGRLLCGVAPWLENEAGPVEEADLRAEFADLARRMLAAGTDPSSPDFLNFTRGSQPVVDAAFLAQALLRAPQTLWRSLDASTQQHVIAALRSSRVIRPHFNNWLLFAAIIEAFLFSVDVADADPMRIDYALRQHEQWYLGDGHYGDGPEFHWDYYNAFVIQPMLLDILDAVGDRYPEWVWLREAATRRAQRYAAVQERLISPEGTYPPIGRSLAYRFGAFQVLAQMALRRQLPEDVSPAAVRSALTAVIRRQIEAPGVFDADGWLRIGFAGHQPGLGERYISTGSLYLCSAGLLPLGLPADDPFWSAPAQAWTAKRIWAGEDAPCDHALHGRG
ncbi:MAG: DUF2264 domain-containing protein [Caldilineaceae bacterium]|nr:DUF2264 domain-containing protein [Caldilineaceae bacterium]